MPCLSLRKNLFPSIKTWKSFTTKILQKLHNYKIIKITKSHKKAKTIRSRAQPPMYYPTLSSKKNKHHKNIKNRRQIFGVTKALHRPKHEYRFKKRSLVDPPPVFVDELFWTQTRDVGLGGPTGKPGPIKGPETVSGASPRLRGIDARAEEFIARFRAELEYQEIVAHGL